MRGRRGIVFFVVVPASRHSQSIVELDNSVYSPALELRQHQRRQCSRRRLTRVDDGQLSPKTQLFVPELTAIGEYIICAALQPAHGRLPCFVEQGVTSDHSLLTNRGEGRQTVVNVPVESPCGTANASDSHELEEPIPTVR